MKDMTNLKEWKCSLDHPKITPELRKMLYDAFGRLAYLNVSKKLTEEEQLERDFLSSLHSDFRFGRRKFRRFIGRKYFRKK